MGSICTAFPNPGKEALEGYTRQLDMVIQNTGREYRREMELLVADLNRGVGSGDNGKSNLLPNHLGCRSNCS